MESANHILPDVLEHGLITVFCGRAPSIESRRRSAYYAHPTNRFWAILAETGLTDRMLEPDDFRNLPQYGVGLTDLNKTEFGSDHQLTGTGDDPDSVYEKIKHYQPRILAFTGKNNARMFLTDIFGRQRHLPLECGKLETCNVGRTELIVLPSTSARAGRFWDAKPWHDLASMHLDIRRQIDSE